MNTNNKFKNTDFIEAYQEWLCCMQGDIHQNKEVYRRNSKMRLPLAKKWLKLLKAKKVDKADVENLAREVFDFECINLDPYSMGSELFSYIYDWAKIQQLMTPQIEMWKMKLNIIRYIKTFERVIKKCSEDEVCIVGHKISKRWLELTDLSSTTQTEIDSMMNELLSPNLFGWIYWDMVYDFRNWAYTNGYNVPNIEILQNHWKIAAHNYEQSFKK